MMVCRRTAARLDAYLDGELGERDRQAVELHLAACDRCRRLYQESARQARLIESLPRVGPSADLRRRIMANLPAIGPAGEPARRTAGESRIARPAVFRRRAVLAGAALAAVGAIIAAALLLTAPGRERPMVVQQGDQQQQAIAQKEPAAPVVEHAAPAEEAPVTVTPSAPSKKTAPRVEPEPREPETTPTEVAEAYRDLASDYEREGRLSLALEAYQQADAAEEQPASVEVAQVYEKMGYAAEAADWYADLALGPIGAQGSNHNGG